MHRKFVIHAGIVVILLGLLIFFSRSNIFQAVKGGIFKVMKPALNLITATRFLFSSTNLSEEEVVSLIQENQRLKAESAELEQLRTDNRTIKNILDIKKDVKLPFRASRVLQYRNDLGREFLVIDRGTADGVQEGDLIIDQNGFFVGTIKETFSEVAKVEIGSNQGETFEVEIIPFHAKSLAKGIGGRSFSLDLIPNEALVERGDFVMLLGVGLGGGRYSYMFGEIVNSKPGGNSIFKRAEAVLLSHPEMLREVFVVESHIPL